MRSVTAGLATLGALSLPSLDKIENPLASLTTPVRSVEDLTPHERSDSTQDPKKEDPQNPEVLKKNLDTLRARLAVSEANLETERATTKELRATQDAFNRMRKLGTPMEHEAALRHSVDDYLSALEHHQKTSVPQSVLRLYGASVDAIFSEPNIKRDQERLLTYLADQARELTEEQRVSIGSQLVTEMKGWAAYLKTPEAIQRLEAATSGQALAAGSGLRVETAKDFLTNPVSDNVRVLGSLSNEYVAAKALFLERVLKVHGILGTQEQENR